MNKEITLTKELIEYWKNEFRYMSENGFGETTFKEFITGEAGSSPDLDATLEMWGPATTERFYELPKKERNEIARYRYYEAFPSQIAASVGITIDELLNMSADEFITRF